MIELHTRLKDTVFCALDLETTGTNAVTDRIVEVGMVRFTLDEDLADYSSFVNPLMPMPENVIPIHGITDEMVKDAPVIEDILPAVVEFIGDSPLVIQNPRFDLAFLNVAFNRLDRTVPPFTAYDTVRLARNTFSGLPNYRLATLCAKLDIHIHHHRALDDATGCMEVFRKIVRCHNHDDSWSLADLERIHGDVLRPRLTRKEKMRLNINNKIFIGEEVRIRYMDEEGNITTRRILPKEVVRDNGRSYLYAYCYLREADRYFNTRRILKIY